MDSSQRLRYGQKASLIGLLCNLGLFGVKCAVGITGHAMSVVADAFNNLSDALSSLVSFLAVRLSAKPADSDHPYGHGRSEYIASFIVSFLVLLFGCDLLKSSVEHFSSPEPPAVGPSGLVLLVLAIAVKLGLFFFYRYAGSRASLEVLLVSSKDSLFDCLSTGLTLLAVLLSGRVPFSLDAAAGVLLSALIVLTGIRLLRDAASPLLGSRPDSRLTEDLTTLVRGSPEVLGIHDVRLHDYGYRHAVGSMHIELPDTLTFRRAHEIADGLEQEAREKLGVDLVIHMDPISVTSHLRDILRGHIEAYLEEKGGGATLHDFQLSTDHTPYLLSFDLSLPYRLSGEEAEQFRCDLLDDIRRHYPNLRCSIRLDRG